MKPTHHQLKSSRSRGLSLFELLVVLTIAAVLAGLAYFAMTNVLHRTKHQRVLEEHRLLSRALQNYSLDHGNIPAASQGLAPLLRPTVYMASLPRDPFQTGETSSYLYLVPNHREVAAILISPGPDQKFHLPDELWEFAYFHNVDQNMIPASVRARHSGRDNGPIGTASSMSLEDNVTHEIGTNKSMSESQMAILMTYINLGQYHPDRGAEGDIITVTYY
ncbi:MAG: prepilin-type N-terminal cleavage/methylation domain-containing protein [Candidatus Sumerlaeia bacterium]|nr:prepilin-type N-terminal cleavage/methylation domain-containing protein [Candidatus Sumerlaeia bacterium]